MGIGATWIRRLVSAFRISFQTILRKFRNGPQPQVRTNIIARPADREHADGHLAALLASILLIVGSIWFVVATPSWDVKTILADDINDGGVQLAGVATVTGSWTPSGDGLALRPGAAGEVLLPIVTEAGYAPIAYLWFRHDETLRTEVACSVDGVEWTSLSRDEPLNGSGLDLGRCQRDGTARRVLLRLRASRLPEAVGQVLVFDKIQVTLSKGFQPVSPVLLFLSLQIPLVIVFGGLVRTPRTRQVWPVVLVVALSGTFLAFSKHSGLSFRDVPFTPGGRFVFAEVLAGLGVCSIVPLLRTSRGRPPISRNTLVLAVIGAGFALRWERLLEAAPSPLYPDTETASLLASRLGSMYEASSREPLWIWLTKLSQWVFGVGPLASRAFSVAVSTVLLVVIYLFLRHYTGRWSLAFLTTTLLAAHPYLLESSCQGHRTELILVTLFACFFFVLVPTLSDRQRTIGLAISVPLACLTQMGALAVVGAALGYGVLRGRLRLASVFAAALSVALLVGPFLLQCSRKYRDPFYCLNIHAVFYRNYEFVRILRVGCPGCPDEKSLAKNSYAGEPVTMFQYIFGMHSMKEVVIRSGLGYAQVFGGKTDLGVLLGTGLLPVRMLYLFGALVLMLTPWRELLLIPVVVLNLFSFVVPLGVDPRLLASTIPVLVFLLALPVWVGIGSLFPAEETEAW